MKRTSILFVVFLTTFSLFSQTEFELIELPYAIDALEPVISKSTIELHHGKHLKGYVNNLNKLVKGTDLQDKPLYFIVKNSQGAIFNNAGQTHNHNLYFTQFQKPSENNTLDTNTSLYKEIIKTWGSFDKFKEEYNKAATGLFGSGWVWLSKNENGSLVITQQANGSNPVVNGLTPLLGIDVWEHAYYLDYQNRRADHINAFWKIINWKKINERYVE